MSRAGTAVWFDLDGTLLVREGGYGEVVRGALDRAGLADAVDADAFADQYGEMFHSAFGAFEPDPVETAAERAFAELGVGGAADSTAFADALLLAERAATTVPAGAREAVDVLAGHPGRSVGVLTNGVGDWQRAKLAYHGLLDRVEAVVASYDVGAHKPDQRAFEAAESALPAGEYIYVCDDYEDDVEPALDRGWRTVHVDRRAEDGLVVAGDVGDLLAVSRPFCGSTDEE